MTGRGAVPMIDRSPTLLSPLLCSPLASSIPHAGERDQTMINDVTRPTGGVPAVPTMSRRSTLHNDSIFGKPACPPSTSRSNPPFSRPSLPTMMFEPGRGAGL